MAYNYKTKGTCSRSVSFDIRDGRVYDVYFEGGCNGNTKGIAALAQGRDAAEVAKQLRGIRCGFKDTSCPDQFARALEQVLAADKNNA